MTPDIKPYKTLNHPSEVEIIINKSRFIGRAYPVSCEDEAKAILASIKKQHYDATHNCYAYVMRSGVARYSDDGEPGGTAGMPIMDVLKNRDVADVLCVVTRYFGGILLGAGGLVRAYSKSAAEAVLKAQEVLITPGALVKMTVSYDRYGALEGFIRENSCSVDIRFLDKIYIDATVISENASDFVADITEKSDGRVIPEISGFEYVKMPIHDSKA